MPGVVHFEIFFRPNAGAPWTLHASHAERAAALAAARELAASHPTGAARVSKESLNEVDGVYSGVIIATFGDLSEAPGALKPSSSKPEPICCHTPADFYKGPARRQIAEILAKFLIRRQALAIELLHRADLIEYLESDDLALDAAFQRAALGRAHRDGVHKTIRELKDLAEAAMSRVFKDEAQGKLREIEEGALARFLERLAGAESDHRYYLGAGIAKRIAAAGQWREKLETLLDLRREAEALAGAAEPPALLGLMREMLDDFLEEFCTFAPAIEAVVGERRNLARRLETLLALAAGDAQETPFPLDGLAEIFRAGGARSARNATFRRALNLLQSPRRLVEDDLAAEARMVGRMAGIFLAATGLDVRRGEIEDALAARARQILDEDRVGAYLSGRSGGARLLRMLALLPGLYGLESRRRLALMIEGELERRHFWAGAEADLPALERLHAFGRLQSALEASNLPSAEREFLSRRLDLLGVDCLRSEHVLDRIAEGPGQPLERAAALLSIAAREAAPRGHTSLLLAAKAHALIASSEGRADLHARPEAGAEIERLRQAALEGAHERAA